MKVPCLDVSDLVMESSIPNQPQGVKLTFFPGSHLAPKCFKVVANSKKVGGHDTHTKPFLPCH